MTMEPPHISHIFPMNMRPQKESRRFLPGGFLGHPLPTLLEGGRWGKWSNQGDIHGLATGTEGLMACKWYKVVPLILSVQLVNISTISLGFIGVISIVNGDYKLTYNWGGTTLYDYILVILSRSLCNFALIILPTNKTTVMLTEFHDLRYSHWDTRVTVCYRLKMGWHTLNWWFSKRTIDVGFQFFNVTAAKRRF